MNATSMALSAGAFAASNQARENSENALRLQCKQTYDDSVCFDVCHSGFRTKISKGFWKAEYEYTGTNECTNSYQTVPIGVQNTGTSQILMVVLLISIVFFVGHVLSE